MRPQRADGVLPYLQNRFEQSYPQALDKPLRAKPDVNVYSNYLTYVSYGVNDISDCECPF